MRISELQDKWNSISPLTDGFLLASGDHPLSFHIGYYNGVKTFIVMNTGEIINLKSSKGINVACINTQLDEFSLRFSLLYESLEELFIKLCWDLIEYTKTSVDPVKEILTRYYNWLKLFQIDKVKLLSSNIQKGLIGELLFLKDCIENKGENNALTAWVGPEGSDQDFVFTDYWAEVKTVSISASEVGISSLQQLDRIDEGNLVVFFMDKTSSDGQNTISLYSIYTDILNIINSRDNIDVFLCKIAKYGLMEKNIQEYKENKYTLAECRSYKVTTKFPRLSKNNIPIEVTSARYGIDLATIEIYRIRGIVNMDVKEFQKDFLEEVKATAATDGEGSNAAFVQIISSYLISSEVLSDFSPAFYSGKQGSKKLRVDGYVYDEFDNTFNLAISDYCGDENRETITKTYATQQFDFILHFIEESFGNKLFREVEQSTPASDLIDLLRLNKDRIRKFRFLLFTDGFMSGRINDIVYKNINGIPIECQIWDVERIFRVCFSDLGRQAVEIDFKKYTNGNGIPCLEASNTNNDDYKSYLCIIPGTVLADIYDSFGSQLLEGNVRSFLSTKVAVNKKIRETIIRIPQNFFAYNNGVSATAMNLKFENTSKGRYITYAKDFQIINGGQTTASLSNARYKDNANLDSIYVQMKLTEVDSDADRATELIRNISRSSNSQNKVSDADFFATHPFHVRMEQISERTFAPATGGSQFETKWFYERARGQYLQKQMRLTKSQKDKFITQHPKKQLITKTDLAKYRNSWAGAPQVVSKGAQTNFMKFAEIIDDQWTKNDKVFNDKYFKDTISLAILFKHTEYVVSHQPWFEQGYRANIVTYSIALLHKLIKNQFTGKDLDLQLIWNRQHVPDSITNELVKITKAVFDSITDPNRSTMNVTQWCKRDACWDAVKKIDIQLGDDFDSFLISNDVLVSADKQANSDQKLRSGVEAQAFVLQQGAEYWKKLNTFVLSKKIVASPKQIEALKYAMKIPVMFPSAYQSQTLLYLLEEAKLNGFVE